MTTEIALFPIPGLVTFPGNSVPLHVFEPRYRRMIDDCVKIGRMIGVCHTRREIHRARRNQTRAEALTSNQATYEPCEVFSAGNCEVIAVSEDGRLQINIEMVARYRIEEEIQTLPYRIVRASEVVDDNEEEDLADLQLKINQRLLKILGPLNPAVAMLLGSRGWTSMPAGRFSFRVFQFLQFDPELMQEILEQTRPSIRLHRIEELLANAP